MVSRTKCVIIGSGTTGRIATESGCMAALDVEHALTYRSEKNGIYCIESLSFISTIFSRNGINCIETHLLEG